MKGLFFINFMIIMSCITVVSLILWQYLQQKKSTMPYIAGCILTAAAIGVLWFYGKNFETLSTGTAAFNLVFYGALGSLSWLFMFFLFFPLLLAGALICAIWRQRQKRKAAFHGTKPAGLSRRRFLQGTAAMFPVLAFSTSAYGIFEGERQLECTHHALYFARIPEELEGYRIGQISDPHMGLFFSPERLREAMRTLAAEKVNRLVITGDLIDELSLLPQCQAILKEEARLFPDGIDYVYGNHEYYRGLEKITAMLKNTPVRILRNDSRCIMKGDTPVYLAGVDYAFARAQEAFDQEREQYVKEALEHVPEQAFVILLAHHSAFIDEGFRHGAALTLTGHTHGGQIGLFRYFPVGFKYMSGMFCENGLYGYVNNGTGHWVPLRLGCSREVSVFEFHKKIFS